MAETITIGGLELRFLQRSEESAGCIVLFEMTVQPNARMPVPHYHDLWEETIYGLTGTLTWRIDGEEIVSGPGQSVFIQRGVVHSFRNDTQQPAKCLCIITPGLLGPAYFREIAALVANGPPDMETMKATMLRYGLVPVLSA